MRGAMSHDTSSERPQRKPPGPVTVAWLQRSALHYLESYSSSSENLRRVLRRKLDRRCRQREEDPAAFLTLVDQVVAQAVSGGYVDDARYAEAKIASLRRKGGSRRAIAAKLSAGGIDRELVSRVLAAEEREEARDDAAEDAEAGAARAYARRRRLGPFRATGRDERRDRDIAAMMRAGFAFDLARRVIDGDPDDALDR